MAHNTVVSSLCLLSALTCALAELPVRAESDEEAGQARARLARGEATGSAPRVAAAYAPEPGSPDEDPGWRPQLGLYFSSAVPMGAFGNRVDDPALGVSLVGGVGLPQLPVVLGAEFSFMDYGRDSRSEIINTSAGSVEGRLTTTNELITGHLLLRVQPRSGWVRPYAEGLVGFKDFSTRSRVTVPQFDLNDPNASTTIASKKHLDDTALSYGPGAGLDLLLWSSEEGGGSLRINLGARYLFGERARYLEEGSIRTENGQVFVEILESRTDMITAHGGLFLEF